jgi:hypothetical protein
VYLRGRARRRRKRRRRIYARFVSADQQDEATRIKGSLL